MNSGSETQQEEPYLGRWCTPFCMCVKPESITAYCLKLFLRHRCGHLLRGLPMESVKLTRIVDWGRTRNGQCYAAGRVAFNGRFAIASRRR